MRLRSLKGVLVAALAVAGCHNGGGGGDGGADLGSSGGADLSSGGGGGDLSSSGGGDLSGGVPVDLAAPGGGGDLKQPAADLTTGGGGGGPDLWFNGMCSALARPGQTTTSTTTDNIPNPDEPYVFQVGGAVYSALRYSKRWNQWTGTGWSESAIPWPAELTANPDGGVRSLGLASANFRGITELSDGRALFIATDGYTSWAVTFDGQSVRDPMLLPAQYQAVTRGPDGQYQLLTTTRLLTGDPAHGWGPGTPVPLPTNLAYNEVDMAVTTSGRLIIGYVATPPAPQQGRHVYVLGKAPGATFDAPRDISPMWAVSAQFPHVVAPRGGGALIGASGASNNYTVPALWSSSDGITFGAEDDILTGFIDAALVMVRAGCLGSPLVVLDNRVNQSDAYQLLGRSNGSWSVLAQSSASYLEGASCTSLADGRAFWGFAQPDSITLQATQ